MRSPIELIKNSWKLFAKNWLLLAKFSLTSLGITLGFILLFGIIFGILSYMKLVPAMIVLGILAAFVIVVLSSFLGAAGLEMHKNIVLNTSVEIRGALKFGWHNKGKYFTTGLLTGLVMFAGMILLVIPGLIWAVQLTFVMAILAFEGKADSVAMGRSRELVKSRFWQTIGYLVVPTIVAIGVQIVASIIGGILQLPKGLVSSFSQLLQTLSSLPFIFYGYLLYQEYVAHPVETK